MGCDFELWAPEPHEAAAVEGVSLRPSWNATFSIIAAVLEDGTPEGKRLAREELAELARKLEARAAIIAAKDDALAAAERFIAGFEDDELQEGIPKLLEQIRGAYVRDA